MFVYVQENPMVQILQSVEKIEVFENGEIQALTDGKFENTLGKLKDLFCAARLMPAFGVSIHNETLEALRVGDWLKISFSHQQNVNGLLFDALVFHLSETSGVNLIRDFQGKYEGRCLFLDFDAEINLKNLIK